MLSGAVVLDGGGERVKTAQLEASNAGAASAKKSAAEILAAHRATLQGRIQDLQEAMDLRKREDAVDVSQHKMSLSDEYADLTKFNADSFK